MSTVALVEVNGSFITATDSKEFPFRVQLNGKGETSSNGFVRETSRTGWYRFQNEEGAKRFVASAVSGKTTKLVEGKMTVVDALIVPGKIVYKDQLTPIVKNNPGYGLQVPYLNRLNGVQLELGVRVAIQKEAAIKGLSWMQSGMPIYRQKFYSPDVNEADTILSPDNTDEVIAFAASVVASMGNGTDKAVKEAKLLELRGIAKGKRTPEEKALLLELTEELEN